MSFFGYVVIYFEFWWVVGNIRLELTSRNDVFSSKDFRLTTWKSKDMKVYCLDVWYCNLYTISAIQLRRRKLNIFFNGTNILAQVMYLMIQENVIAHLLIRSLLIRMF